ncbi:MAG: hypothetical protein KGL68_06475 [Burkholderiales bacterium]|nr:hypothetical protein [Burkholderiales bacterium]
MLAQAITLAEPLPNPGARDDEPSVARDVVLRHLKDPAEIATVLHLRDEIDLSVHAAGGLQQFESLEKKETSAGSCSPSTSTASGSAPSASFRWATASP